MPVHPHITARLEATLPPAAVTRARLRDYMSSLDHTASTFGPLINYSEGAVRAFLNDTYTKQRNAKSDTQIREAIEQYIARHPLGQGPDAPGGQLYETGNVRQMRQWFQQCHQHAAMIVGYGPPGSQKTYVATHLVAEFNRSLDADSRDRAYLVRCSIGIRPRDLMAKVCAAVGAPSGGSLQRCLTSLRHFLRDRNVTLILDEAQLADIPALEAVRELHDTERVGILLLGSHQLNRLFEVRAAELEQFNSRIEDRAELKGVGADEARGILALELPELPEEEVATAIEDAMVKDSYSNERNKAYCSIRRLTKTIAIYRRLLDESGSTPTLTVVGKEAA